MNEKKGIKIPYWLLKLLPMWDHICPKCKHEVEKKSHKCLYCGENYGMPLRVPPKVLKDAKALEAYVHKYIFPKVSALYRDYLTQFFTIIFQSGFEPGNFTEWTGTTVTGGDTCAVQTGIAHHGVYGMRSSVDNIDGDDAYAHETIAAAGTYFVRIYVRFNTIPTQAGGKRVNILSLWDSVTSLNSPVGCVLINDGNWIGRAALAGVEAVYNAVPPVTGLWYCVEMKVVASLTVGEVRVYINGTERTTLTALNQTTTIMNLLRVGCNNKQSSGVGAAASMDIDCVVLADAYTGLEPLGLGTISVHAKLIGAI